ncbi:MAG: acyl-CoA reductase [Oscillospiraceae bacterium]|nr:acyl-CoA reductase [Oscillospiraceae bacterium]
MILANGKRWESSMQSEILAGLEAKLNATLAGPPLEAETVVAAIDELGKRVAAGEFDERIAALQIDGAEQYKELAVRLLRRDNLEFMLRTELGADFRPDYLTEPPAGLQPVRVLTRPLGVLLHIAAGNADGLPAFSVAEGLVTGNINILKLPQADNGLSLEIFQALLELEPRLADYIYVFDTPSSDVGAIQRMAELADGIVVWGGEAAVSAVRRFAHPGTKLIEWGHRLSFAYLSGAVPERELTALAEHLVVTRQLLCSSCQVIYLDTERMEDLRAFCDRFWPILQRAAEARRPRTLGAVAELTLRTYTDRLEAILNGGTSKPWSSPLCSLIPKEDSALELSPMFANVLVKRLPRQEILPVLRKAKSYLQTAGLACPPAEREALTQLLAQAGLTRITRPGSMSEGVPGEAHDGSYPLQRYIRIVNVEI